MTTDLTPRQQMLLANWLRLKHLPPPGYVHDPTRTRFVLDADTAPLLRRAWERVIEGVPVDQVLALLNDELGYRTVVRGRTGGKPLSRTVFYRILRDPFYSGRIRSRFGLVDGEHEAIVTVAEFEIVQEMLTKRRRNNGSPSVIESSPPVRHITTAPSGP